MGLRHWWHPLAAADCMRKAMKWESSQGPGYTCCICGKGTDTFIYLWDEEDFTGDGFPIGSVCLSKVKKLLKEKSK